MTDAKNGKTRAAAEALEFLTRGRHVVALLVAQLGLLFGVFYLLRRLSPLDAMVCATISAVTTILISGGALWLLVARLSSRRR